MRWSENVIGVSLLIGHRSLKHLLWIPIKKWLLRENYISGSIEVWNEIGLRMMLSVKLIRSQIVWTTESTLQWLLLWYLLIYKEWILGGLHLKNSCFTWQLCLNRWFNQNVMRNFLAENFLVLVRIEEMILCRKTMLMLLNVR